MSSSLRAKAYAYKLMVSGFTGLFIRDYLLKRGEAYVYEMYREYKKHLESLGFKRRVSYDSFRRYIYILERLGLIVFVRAEYSTIRPYLEPKRYYRINPMYANLDIAWINPQAVLYPEAVYGGRRYWKKVMEAKTLGITVRELALRENPEIARIRRILGVK